MLGDRNFSMEKLDTENLDHQQGGSQHSFKIRPDLDEKFRPQAAKEAIQSLLTEQLSGKVYANENVDDLTKSVAKLALERVKAMEFQRYKLLVQVVLGEQRGAGVRMGARCMWDAEADSYASAEYANDSLFCVVTVFAVFVY
ncbi:dynein light chain Tctex-type protein 2B-like [Frankliniella occidentalis]|uniref:Dynein light chain Tctex-type protein 2B-like n=1 Tax=Frankliniella occidentalis TaxID=133901 RepID=A0A6J1SXN3_FRAOC|nr:dynein light chain Tctex-type protein 2B-like [Frankliniella occidentalis]